jgi:hypothetical protein
LNVRDDLIPACTHRELRYGRSRWLRISGLRGRKGSCRAHLKNCGPPLDSWVGAEVPIRLFTVCRNYKQIVMLEV